MRSSDLPFILASGSPRRKELLALMGVKYVVDVSDADESFCGAPDDMVAELSRRKAEAVAVRHDRALILAADTVVYCDGVLGKPGTAERAKEMLHILSGKWHSVYTGVTLINTATGEKMTCVDVTKVHFVQLTDEEIDTYVATNSPLDKAGAYGIQDMGGMFVDRIEGSYSNVVGLPMSMLRGMLAKMNEQRVSGV